MANVLGEVILEFATRGEQKAEAALGKVAGAVAEAQKGTKALADSYRQTFAAGSAAAQKAGRDIGKGLGGAVQSAQQGVSSLGKDLKGSFAGADKEAGGLGDALGGIGAAGSSAAGLATKALGALGVGAAAGVLAANALGKAWDFVGGVLGGLYQRARQGLTDLWRFFKGLADQGIAATVEGHRLNDAWTLLARDAANVWVPVTRLQTTALLTLHNLLRDLAPAAREGIGALIDKGFEWLESLPNIKEVGEAAIFAVLEAWDALKATWTAGVNVMKAAAVGLFDVAKTLFGSLGVRTGDVKDTVEDLKVAWVGAMKAIEVSVVNMVKVASRAFEQLTATVKAHTAVNVATLGILRDRIEGVIGPLGVHATLLGIGGRQAAGGVGDFFKGVTGFDLGKLTEGLEDPLEAAKAAMEEARKASQANRDTARDLLPLFGDLFGALRKAIADAFKGNAKLFAPSQIESLQATADRIQRELAGDPLAGLEKENHANIKLLADTLRQIFQRGLKVDLPPAVGP